MKTGITKLPGALRRGSLLAVVVDDRWSVNEMVRELDRRSGGLLIAEARRRRFTGQPGESVALQTQGALPNAVVALLGGDCQSTHALFTVADRLGALAESERTRHVSVHLPLSTPATLRTVAEGVALARHRFDEYRSQATPLASLRLAFVVDKATADLRQALRHAEIRARSVCLARDLSNTPAGDLPPVVLGERAAALAQGPLKVVVHGPKKLAQLGMGALLAVGQGSRNPPRLIEMRYEPREAAAHHYTLIGKGITFDSGGLSLKSGAGMESMKRDMGGGATVIATMNAIAELGLPLRVRAYIPCAENMPDGNAIRPGDVVRACNGTTIEILNTDAEGRLVLADAIAHAVADQPAGLIDFATLTGAVRAALGKRFAAIMGNDQELVDGCLRAADECGEGLWQLPLVDDYRQDLNSDIADIKNTGAGNAGCIVAGLFLRDFVGATPWAHIDFSSTVMSDGYPCHPKGPSGYGVRTAIGVLEGIAAR